MAAARQRWKEGSARYVSTLVNLDGPQVVMLDHGDDAKIIGVAIDKEGYDYPFLGAEISFSQWERYNRQFVQLRYLFLVPRWKRWYIFDLADHDEKDRIPLERADKADYQNEKYLPSYGFWARSHTEENPVFESSAEVTSQKFLIDGTWDPPDISQFFARINDLYPSSSESENFSRLTQLTNRSALWSMHSQRIRFTAALITSISTAN